MENDQILERQGYGATMNRLTIDRYHKTITKTSLTEEGHRKISLEMSLQNFPVLQILK